MKNMSKGGAKRNPMTSGALVGGGAKGGGKGMSTCQGGKVASGPAVVAVRNTMPKAL